MTLRSGYDISKSIMTRLTESANNDFMEYAGEIADKIADQIKPFNYVYRDDLDELLILATREICKTGNTDDEVEDIFNSDLPYEIRGRLGYYGWTTLYTDGDLTTLEPDEAGEELKDGEESKINAYSAVKTMTESIDTVAQGLDVYVKEDGTFDVDHLQNELEIELVNYEPLYREMFDTRMKAHSIAFNDLYYVASGLGKNKNITNKEIKKYLADKGVDYKELLKPICDRVEEERAERKNEMTESADEEDRYGNEELKKLVKNLPDSVKYKGKTYKAFNVMSPSTTGATSNVYYCNMDKTPSGDPQESDDYFFVKAELNKVDNGYDGVKEILWVEDLTEGVDEDTFEVGELKRKAQEVLPKEDIDTHEGDLYIRKTPESTRLINRMKNKNSGLLKTFKSQIDGDIWYEIPFANWEDDYNKKYGKVLESYYGDDSDYEDKALKTLELIEDTIESNLKELNIPKETLVDNGAIFYMNGNDGTDFDWRANDRTCEFMSFYKNDEELGAIKVYATRRGTIEGYYWLDNGKAQGVEIKPVKTDIDGCIALAAAMCDFADNEYIIDDNIDKINIDGLSNSSVEYFRNPEGEEDY